MPRLLVIPLSRLTDAIALHRPSHIVSLLSPHAMIQTPAGFPAERHLRLEVNDIADPAAGTHPPTEEHIQSLIAFSRDWPADAPMIIHCWAGISRSMASAFTVLCDRLGEASEHDISQAMRRRAPHAAPNKLLVRHADVLLNRGGRMLAALEVMGPPLIMEQGVDTDFPLANL